MSGIYYLAEYNCQWLSFAMLCMIFMCAFPVRRAVGWLGALTVFWFMATGLNVVLNPYVYKGFPDHDLLGIKFFSADAMLKLCVVMTPILYFAASCRRNLAAWGMIAFSLYCLVDAVIVVLQLLLDPNHCKLENTCGSIIGNPSMNACFLVVLLPLALKTLDAWARPLAVLLVLASIVISKASIPVGLFAAMPCLFAATRASPRLLLAAAALVGGVFLAAHQLLGSELFNSGDRVLMWKFFLSKFNVPENQAFGVGYGVFGVFSQNLQMFYKVRSNGWWVWIHNDWLQSFFEAGAIGLGLMLLTYARAGILLLKDGLRHEAVSLGLYGLMMFCNYPTHLGPTAVFGAWLAAVALSSRTRVCVEDVTKFLKRRYWKEVFLSQTRDAGSGHHPSIATDTD